MNEETTGEKTINSIEKLTIARQMLSEAKSMDDILHIRDIAEAARVYAQAARLGLENQNEAAEIKIRAERKAGEMLAQINTHLQGGDRRSKSTVDFDNVYRATLQEEKIPDATASRWQMIASLPEDEFEDHIHETKADGKELTTVGIIREVMNKKRSDMHEAKRTKPFPSGKYSVIYADPPWRYDNSGLNTSAENQYPTMSLEEICSLPIRELSESTTVLFLWATNPLLPEALKVIESWGFKYKTNIVWIKGTGAGIGWFEKSAHEILMIAVRENTPHPKERPISYFEEARTIHSKKPEMAYEIIESMYPGNKIELFARNARDGWTLWGNENV